MIKFLIPFLLIPLCFSSCSSTGGVQVIGEKNRIYNNILSEYYLLGEAYLENKKYDKAIEFYTKALISKELAESARYKIAYSYAMAENWDKAIPAYKELLEKDPENTDLEISLAYIYARKGELDHSSAMYRKLTEKNPHDESLLENFITVLISGNYLEEAEVALNRLKTDFPENEKVEELEENLAYGWEEQEGSPPEEESTEDE